MTDAPTHLWCRACSSNVTIARLNTVAHAVCHCTHVGGEIDPVPLGQMAITPDRWEWVRQGEGGR